MDTFNDPTGRARAATIAIWAWLAADLLYAVSGLVTIAALGGIAGFLPAPETADAVAMAAGLVLLPGYIVAVVLVARWIYRVNANAHAMSDSLTVSPGWNVGWFFVPIANLWKPFEGLRQTWQASESPADPGAVRVPDVMRLWWGLWIVTNILGNISFRLSLNATSVDAITAAAWIDVVSFAIDVPMTWALASVIRALTALQRRGERYAETFA